jgi:hypothetical protein
MTNFVWNPILMGVIFIKKSNVSKLGPQGVAPFHQMGAYQAAEKGPTKKKYNFEFKIQIEQGSFLHKKLL